MKLKFLWIALLGLFSYTSSAQYGISGAYSPTFESYGIGFGYYTWDALMMNYELGFSDEFFSMGMDLGFPVYTSWGNHHGWYIGGGASMLLMDDIDKETGYTYSGSITYRYYRFYLTYSFGGYEYDGEAIGGYDYFHNVRLAIDLTTEITERRVRRN